MIKFIENVLSKSRQSEKYEKYIAGKCKNRKLSKAEKSMDYE